MTDSDGTPETHTVVVNSPNKPRPTDVLAIAVADTLRRVENNYHREGSGPGSRFEGELLEDVQARTAIAMVRAWRVEEDARAELKRPAPELAAVMAALEDIARAAQDHADSTGTIDHNWLVETALRGLGRMPASEDEQAEADDVRPRADGLRGLDITCGACGEDYGTNVTDLDEIECVECDARRCPHCKTWFGGQS